MFRNKLIVTVFCAAMLVISSGAVPVFASSSTPGIVNVFKPASPTSALYNIQVFQSALYLAVSDEGSGTGGQIWRSKDGNTWAPVTGLGFGINSSYSDSWDMTVFDGKLYATANCFPIQGPDCPGVILRTSNGKDWEQIPLATGTALLDKIGVSDDAIYATSVWGGGQIWRSHSGNPGTWEAVKDFGLPDGYGTGSPTEYKGQVYIPVDNVNAQGDSIVIYHSADGRHWNTSSLKITNQDPTTGFTGGFTMGVFNGELYLCVTNSLDGGTIYRSYDGKNWEKVVQTLSVFGFRDITEYNHDLYAITFYFVDGSNYGAQLWSSHNGNPGSWGMVNVNPANWGLYSGAERGTMTVFNGSLYIASGANGVFRFTSH